MSKALIFAALLAGLPAAAYAQDTRDNPVNAGAAAGAAVGAAATAPLAAAAGIVGGLTGVEAPRFHHYVIEEQIPSYMWPDHPRVVVGDVLPPSGVMLYPVPPEYGVTRYEYTIVGAGRPVEPSDRRGRTVGSPAPKSKDGWKTGKAAFSGLSRGLLRASSGDP